MAGSRVERLSTIFKRYTGLIKSGAILEENRPLWYDIYKSFPPSTEPQAIRPEPKTDIIPIFYPEDILRGKFYRTYGNGAVIHDFITVENENRQIGTCELFIAKYLELARKKSDEIDLNNDELFRETERILREENGVRLSSNSGKITN